jgi:hypothetical protein
MAIWLCSNVCFKHDLLFLTDGDGHGLDVKVDAAEWLLVFFFDKNFEASATLGIRRLQINVSRL